jgi:tRNA-specific 2-thiouridylase
MRFDRLYRKAMELGAEYVATGHYASIQQTSAGRHLLIRAKDRRKDQTYMLYTITQQQLSHTLYPLGGMDKSTTRAMAREYGLEVADKPDSQDICFIPGGDYKRFLRDYLPEEPIPGPMVMTDGQVVGQHTGITNYTVGQRKGIGLVWPRPLYVVDIKPETNTVVVGEAHDVFASELVAYDLNLIPFDRLNAPLEVEAKIRYGAIPAKALVTPLTDGQRCRVEFAEPQRAITPGQAVVFYQGEIVIGGGTIARTK